ncbi:MAG: hypothetical protein J6N54_08620 [Bacteroidales bacterium]|nr:hypothetical protein [Bacteroidales bacterium]
MKKVTIEIPEGKALKFKDGAYVLVDDNVMERIKTFDDACREVTGKSEEEWLAENETKNVDKDVLAYLKMRIIVAALNEGWKPTFKEDEYRYYPYYYAYTKSEWESLSALRRKELEPSVCLVGGASDNGSQSGPLYVRSDAAWSAARSDLGARLAFKSGELARYAGKQFFDIFKDFYYNFE